ncbi:MAG: hypothetical protein K0S23_892 [Fluviicola sp.]|jgi:hypothetical protein|uniref:T9SS type A sorting domain-containing protein n=1 Tax=Fluviicola sp. TaxID=1917219 RepID=UPI002632EEB8|nr:T9SS type A sorting domain-containing protein [Fluviicola sp.]MDF3026585.1 hypothetical protein [Fluviicola sp.]
MAAFRFLCLCFLLPLTGLSQIPYTFQVNVGQEVVTGETDVTHPILDIGSINDVFDGNTTTLARTAAINPMVITLDFNRVVAIGDNRIMNGAGNGEWTLECANSLMDLNNQTGSYQLLVNQVQIADNIWNNQTINASARFLRLTLERTTGDDYVHLREWEVEASVQTEVVDICMSPSPIRILPGSEFEPGTFMLDSSGAYHSVDPSLFAWTSNQPALFNVNANGLISTTGISGMGSVTAQFLTLTKQASVTVTPIIEPQLANTRQVNVALVIIDPASPVFGGNTFSGYHSWENPAALSQHLCDSLNAASGGVVNYFISETHYTENLYTLFGNSAIDADSLAQLFLEPGWTTLHYVAETLGQSEFLYNQLLTDYNFCMLSNNETIDEVWVYAMPFVGLYESRLTGNGAFFYNSPPLTGNSCTDHLPIMGFNYERGVAEAWHSYGHRAENAMIHLFGEWNNNSPASSFDFFTLLETHGSDSGHVGNIHFPVNATADYEYDNTSYVTSYASNWFTYPFLFQETELVNCEEWNCSHLGYMSWWHRHLPNKACLDKNGFLNNWWSYIIDFNEGRELETQNSLCNCDLFAYLGNTEWQTAVPNVFPNPTNGNLFVEVDEKVNQLILFDQSYRQVMLLNQPQDNEVDVSGLSVGVYYGQLLLEDGSTVSFKFVKM